jgi:outer membrane protein TolC
MKVKIWLNYLLLLALVTFIRGQNVHVLDLSTSLEIASERNYQMRTLQEDLLRAEYRLTAATNQFKTQINFLLTAPSYNETIRRFEDSLGVYYSPVKQAEYWGNIEISQPLPTDGRFFLRSGVFGLNDFEIERNTVQVSTQLGFEQPIEAFYSYNRIQAGFRQAELSYELSQKRLTRFELDLNYTISEVFYQLIAALENENIARQTLRMQQETTELAQNKYRAGVIAEVEALQMEVDLADALNAYDIAKANRIAQANYLKQLLEIPLTDSIAVETDLSYSIVTVDIEKAIESGLKHRLEIREQEIEKELASIDIQRTRVEGQITGRISAYYDLIGVGTDPNSVALSQTLSSAWNELKRRPGNRGVSLNISIPIWDWGVSRANVEAARADLRKANYSLDNEKVSVEREIRNTVARLNSSLKRLQLLEKNVEVAEKSFEISRQRYANGEINSQSLALDRTRLSNAYLSRLQAYIDFKLLIVDLARKTFYDFERDRSLVEE